MISYSYTLDDSRYETNDSLHYKKYMYNKETGKWLESNITDEYILSLSIFNELIKTRDIEKFEKAIMPLYNKEILLDYYELSKTGYYIAYGNNGGHGGLGNWIMDAYIFTKNYDKLWKFLIQTHWLTITNIINISPHCSNPSINAEALLHIQGINRSRITKYGKKNYEEIASLLDKKLVQFENKHEKNIVYYYFDKWVEKDKLFFASKLYKNSTSKGRSEILNNIGNYLSEDRRLFDFNLNLHCKWIKANGTFEHVFSAIIDEYLRVLENEVRENEGLHKIGEGWISELELYQTIKKLFPFDTIIQHGKPKWLGRQHLDIYFVERNIGIEYQGLQHDQPVEYFGGNDSFKKQQELDKKKQNKCKENGCRLIYVREGYDINKLINEINS